MTDWTNPREAAFKVIKQVADPSKPIALDVMRLEWLLQEYYLRGKHEASKVQGITTEIDEDAWDALASEFSIYCAESGHDREGCFDYEEELYEYVSELLGTDDWEVV